MTHILPARQAKGIDRKGIFLYVPMGVCKKHNGCAGSGAPERDGPANGNRPIFLCHHRFFLHRE
jgi:hypothetical protein